MVTAAICTYKRYAILEKAVRSLVKQTLGNQSLEILVIDNSPAETISRKEAQKYREINNLRWIYESTAGLSNARNVACREARAPIIAYLDDDAVASETWADSLRQTFAEFGDICQVVGGRVDPLWSSSRPAWLSDRLLGYLSVVDLGEEARFLAPGEWVAGANIAYRTDVLQRVGGFDVSLGRVGGGSALMSNEEIALTEKIKEQGGRVVYDPTARVQHLVDAERLTQRWFRKRVAWQGVSDCISGSTSENNFDVKRRWTAVKEYFLHQSPADRTARALANHQQEPNEFEWQLATIYDFTRSILAGLNEDSHE
jgi:glycosyltransferase involved in cell wall biosynthesis